PGPRRHDRHVVRPAAVAALLERYTRVHAPAQRAFLARVAGHDHYELDQDEGDLVLRCEGEEHFRAPCQVLASYGFLSGTLRWAWANPTVEEPLRKASIAVRERAASVDLDWLVEPELPVLVDDANRLATLAAHVAGLGGTYQVHYDDGMLLVAVPPVEEARYA